MVEQKKKDIIDICSICCPESTNSPSIYTKCYEGGIKIKIQDITTTIRVWLCE